MLHLLLGRAGSGKTYTVRSRLQHLAAAGNERLFLLVPEQASFENERALLHLLGPKDAGRISVLSFSRLCDALFHHYGGGAGRRLDDGGRAVLMSQAVDQMKDSLQFYRRSAQGTELVQMLLNAHAEFKTCGISPQDLREAAGQFDLPLFRQKLTELSQILECYEALVAQSWLDPQDDLTRAAACLGKHSFFQNSIVYIDEFQSFTKQQYAVLRQLMRQATETTAALCTDKLEDSDHGMGLFSIVRQTAAALIRTAKEESVRVAPPEILQNSSRYASRDLQETEAHFYRAESFVPTVENERITLYEAADPYEEAAFAGAQIRRLLIDGKCRARDIAVIARDIDSYRGIIDTALETYEIPYFMDMSRDITHEPLMRFLLSAFAVVRTGFDSETLFTYIKTGLAGVSADESAALENYCFTWKISGKAWHSPFTANPEGFAQNFTPQAQRQLESLEKARQRIVKPLEKFAAATADTDGISISKSAYQLLIDTKAPQHLKGLAASLEKAGTPALADDTLRLWDVLMQALDQCALTLGEQPIARSRFEELLRMVIANSQMSSIPQGLDQVTVGSADRIRVENPKVVFILDTAKDDFPKAPGTAGVFSFPERLSLIRGGLPLNDTLAGVDIQERFLAYAAVSAPSDRLYLSWPAAGTDGKAKFPSTIISEMQRILLHPKIQTAETLPAGFFASNRKAAFSQLSRCWKQGTAQEAALKALFAEETDAPRLAALERASDHTPQQFTDPVCAQTLFQKDMHISASQAETYALCPFQYFCKYGLHAKERRAAELDPMEYGSLMHYLLEQLFRQTGAKQLHEMSDEELQQMIAKLITDYVSQQMGVSAQDEPRFHYLLKRLASAAAVITAHIAEELCQSDFVPSDFELPIGPDGIPSLHLTLADGGSVELVGKIDRVDTWQADGRTWLRVVDYKTGKKKFSVSDILYGMNMQMLLYLAALYENGCEKYQNPAPAGILYMPAAVPSTPAERTMSRQKQTEQQEKKLRMSGLVRDDPAILTAMEKNAAGKYIPVKLKAGVPNGAGSAVSGPQMEMLLKYVKRKIQQMAQQLHSGCVAALPLNGKNYDACTWCPYAPVCGHDVNDTVRTMDSPKPEQALQKIMEEEGESK